MKMNFYTQYRKIVIIIEYFILESKIWNLGELLRVFGGAKKSGT